jgi:hypothetical protein
MSILLQIKNALELCVVLTLKGVALNEPKA